MAAYLAWQAGLQTAGIMDHDSVAGCPEFVSACKILGINSTQGFELRANFSGTKVEEKKLNNPDSKNIGYIAIHGIPERRWNEVEKFLKPIQQMRNRRNKEMVEKLNHLIENWGIEKIDFYPDVYAISQAKEEEVLPSDIFFMPWLKRFYKRPEKVKVFFPFYKII
jgi:hypothetical protein